MERTNVLDAKKIFGNYFFGVDEVEDFFQQLDLYPILDDNLQIPFSISQLEELSNKYLLILGFQQFKNNEVLNILKLREIFGINPEKSEPCFYNQDWYLKESFVTTQLEPKWYLIQKDVINHSRSVDPEVLVSNHKINFPTALLCSYAFFINFFKNKEKLWEFDFVWCSDLDHNGDRIYVGKYTDKSGINKNGFSVHRHLSLRDFYGAINHL